MSLGDPSFRVSASPRELSESPDARW